MQFESMRRARLTLPLGAMLGAALLAIGLPAGAAPQTVEVRHAKGTATVPANPARVVTMDLVSLDTLDALGVAVAGVPNAKLPGYLSRYQDASVPKVGTLFEADQAALRAVQPDLVLVGGRSAKQYETLSALAPTLDMSVDRADRIGSLTANAIALGRIFGKEPLAQQKVQALRERVAQLKSRAATAGSALVVLAVGDKLVAQAPGARFGTVHDTFGFAPAMPDLQPEGRGTALTLEQIRDAGPDWLFVIDRDAGVGKEPSPAAAALPASPLQASRGGKAIRVVRLDPVNWYLMDGGGLTGMQATVQQLLDATAPAGRTQATRQDR